MFNPTRAEARQFFAEAWRKFRASEPLSPLETQVAAIVAEHPEYQDLLGHPERHLERDFGPEGGEVNPFLHLSLHLAVGEQLAIDQPPGLRAHYQRLLVTLGDEHAAKHAVLECLAETVWLAQRLKAPPDAAAYLECVARKAR
ncbi:hypothetical protein BURK2_01181 [Burkholderiales bacterium]|nr:MAG: DUF1841 family protein [Burkholderiales bacterium]CAG0969168.1 hypothetical protein BURK2_01181 [Burkholderiales bacterium]